jgi:F-type H+-transporting ATPase subunit gamma
MDVSEIVAYFKRITTDNVQNATKNAGEMINKLQIQYNRSRQAVITNELVEIITGATASADM